MRRTLSTLAAVAASVLLGAAPATAAAPDARTCQPTFDAVAGLAAAIDYVEAGWERPLTADELVMITKVFDQVDRNADQVVCIKIASVVPAPNDPVPQAIDNHRPVR